MKIDFYGAVKAAQRAHKIRNDTLADRIGISLSTLNRKMHSPRDLTIEEFTRLARTVQWGDEDTAEMLALAQRGVRVL